MKKAILSILVALIIFYCIPVFSYAYFDITADDAVNWVLGHTSGVGYEYDGYTGYYDENGNWVYVGPQCVDLIRGYMDRISGTHTRGNGKDYASNSLPDGYTRYYKGTPQKRRHIGLDYR